MNPSYVRVTPTLAQTEVHEREREILAKRLYSHIFEVGNQKTEESQDCGKGEK
jgi:hypothetical protein